MWSFQTVAFPTNRYLFARTVVGNTDIYSADGTAMPVQLTFGSTVETAPQLSPTRDLIAYTSNATGLYQLYTMNRDGSNPRQITTLDVDVYNNRGVGYRWSPDGAYFIYAHNDKLYRINRDGTGRVELATAPASRNFRECDWTAEDGGHLVVQTVGADIFDSELYIYNTDGTTPPAAGGQPAGPGRFAQLQHRRTDDCVHAGRSRLQLCRWPAAGRAHFQPPHRWNRNACGPIIGHQ
ncbi:TolB family protein [Hymenobacter siberiensis]|uniref:TolB family protein n=1 Tax=Hymenobacter siberiensis TaxID=2848396 RepID=UPI001C1DDD1B|nr:hypothetical protein [Hymenobacter siberiensis]MBU6119685.1 hypothetical protein [Hymenobacter siberiensis]